MMERESLQPFELFYCYAREDHALRDELDKHLVGLRRDRLITVWYDGEIVPGAPWQKEISTHLDTADIILFLISADFLNSDYVYENEMNHAIERHTRGEAKVVPILLRSVVLPGSFEGVRLQRLPSNGLAVTMWPNQDVAFTDVAMGVGRVVNQLQAQRVSVWMEPGETVQEERSTPDVTDMSGMVPPVPMVVSQENSALAASLVGQSGTGTGVLTAPDGLAEGQAVSESNVALLVGQHGTGTGVITVPGGIGVGGGEQEPHPRLSVRRVLLVVFLCVFLCGGVLAGGLKLWTALHPSLSQSAIQVTPYGESVGISAGGFAFDVNRPPGRAKDISDKKEASQDFMAGDTTDAQALWQKAAREEPDDAEVLIYNEDQNVLTSGKPYITLVVATILTGDNAQVGRDDLQGAYVAQKEFNNSANGFEIRLLIANSGSADESVATTVAQQIVHDASSDHTIVGVMGWPFSQSSLDAISVLSAAHLPLVSETASTDALTGDGSYFFRVIPPDKIQGYYNAQYVADTLKAKNVALFVASDNSYSDNFASDFSESYNNLGDHIVVTEHYTVGAQGRAQLPALLQDALSHDPDALYFSGYADDLSTLLKALPSSGKYANIPIIGGEGLYELGGYDANAGPHLAQLHFLAYAYPDEWTQAKLTAQTPRFFGEYPNDFDPLRQAPSGMYGFNRADNDVIVSYDAMLALLMASKTVGGGFQQITGITLQSSLAHHIDSDHPLQGASGQIAFGSDGNPVDKPLLLLYVDAEGHFHEQDMLSGCLVVGHCG